MRDYSAKADISRFTETWIKGLKLFVLPPLRELKFRAKFFQKLEHSCNWLALTNSHCFRIWTDFADIS
jgi:hypothetical protein